MKDLGKLLLAVALMSGLVWAQGEMKKKYEPTEIQALKLKVAQQEAIIAQKDVQTAQARLNSALTALGTEANAVKKENGWPDEVNFSPDTLAFSAPVAPAKAGGAAH